MHAIVPIQWCSGETLAAAIEAAGAEPVLLVSHFSRDEIERGLVGDAVDRLMVLSDSAEYTRRFADSMLMQVGGYDDDPRALYEIPEVVRFFRAVDAQWPFWLHFCEKFGESLSVVLVQLVGGTAVAPDGSQRPASVEPHAMRATLLRLFEAMNQLYAMHGISFAENVAMTDKVMAVIDRMFVDPGSAS